MKYSAIAVSCCLLFSLGIASPRTRVKDPLVQEKLRTYIVELIRLEVQASLPSRTVPALSTESPVKQQLLGIQQSINEITRAQDVFRRDFDGQLQQVGHECRRAAAEIAPPIVSNGASLNSSSLRNELQAIALDIVTVKESLEIVQANIQSRSMETIATTEIATTIASQTETIPFSTSSRPAVPVARAFQNAVASKTARIGKSFNGSTIDDVATVVFRATRGGRFATVEFANYLNEAVTDFQLYHNESQTPVYHQAPSQVAANTKEVFTFLAPHCCIQVAFSYWIPSANRRIAVKLQLWNEDKFGLSFLSHNASLETYYATEDVLPGGSESTLSPTYHKMGQIFSRHQNWISKAVVVVKFRLEANVRIELVKEP